PTRAAGVRAQNQDLQAEIARLRASIAALQDRLAQSGLTGTTLKSEREQERAGAADSTSPIKTVRTLNDLLQSAQPLTSAQGSTSVSSLAPPTTVSNLHEVTGPQGR